MQYLNIEIKARCSDPAKIRKWLKENMGDFKGTDHQTDTYFNVPNGRLKLREGNIENNLIFYERNNQAGPKQSAFRLVKVEDNTGLKAALTAANGIKVVVEKKREIWFIENVKFHIDEVNGLGAFMEIEAGNKTAPGLGADDLNEQCHYYMKEMDIRESDLIEISYSDMLLEKVNG